VTASLAFKVMGDPELFAAFVAFLSFMNEAVDSINSPNVSQSTLNILLNITVSKRSICCTALILPWIIFW
jgi:hypothetical protein